ncbi:MAG TPA: hypothetical protein VGF45_05655, partial [Polyangia bacterium]
TAAPKRGQTRPGSGKEMPLSHDPRASEARRACAAGQVERGVELLASIIATTGDPNAVYNQARCYQQNDRHEEAISRFREYLRLAPGEDPAEVRKVEGFIRELEAQVAAKAKRAEEDAPVAAAPEPTPAPIVAPEPVAPSPADALIAVKPPVPEPPAETPVLRMAAHSALAVSAIALGAGGFYAYQVFKIDNELSSPTLSINGPTAQQRVADGKAAEQRQWLGLGAGTVFLVGAGVMYWISAPSREGTRTGFSLWLPAGRSRATGLSLTGRY